VDVNARKGGTDVLKRTWKRKVSKEAKGKKQSNNEKR